ncbi:hypothetical protein E1B28_004037 [Marasmius oreades]|uniref:Glycerophosphocholine acyltransferase 1 n=1 Tax=Marasmius oreades TaxID=181124 RepID=A0A9P7UXW7_9AGAR|nr:uncharacterized protein E1B28_004037 [Marasmius oreades]KAG7096620.1 hypothetical protein E1B28_004037 [Marasmius oreades]
MTDTPTNGLKSPFERFVALREEMSDGFTLLDTLETYFDSHVDLFQRKLQKHSDRLKLKATETQNRMRDLSLAPGEQIAEEVKNFKLKVSQRMTKLSSTWQSAKVVRTREKVSFFVGVMTLLFSSLMFSLAPEWIPTTYTVLSFYLLSFRVYLYKKKMWHYFLFDLCYFVNFLNLFWMWVLPQNAALFVSCYCLTMGSLGSAVVTWRNSLVFHDLDKVTSLFIHLYPPFTFTVIRHFYPNAEERFPALRELPHMQPVRAIMLSGGIYLIWQLLYYKFVMVDRWAKIKSGQRTTSFSFLINEKRGVIGRAFAGIPIEYRIPTFIAGQLVYTILTEVPAVYVLYDSPFWSGAFLIGIFGVSAWNGGGYYIEVFGRKFERELEALRKELAEVTKSGRSSPTSSAESSPTLASTSLKEE